MFFTKQRMIYKKNHCIKKPQENYMMAAIFGSKGVEPATSLRHYANEYQLHIRLY